MHGSLGRAHHPTPRSPCPLYVVCRHREEVRIREKRVERYKDLLIEYYYRSDHVGIAWKDAQDELKK